MEEFRKEDISNMLMKDTIMKVLDLVASSSSEKDTTVDPTNRAMNESLYTSLKDKGLSTKDMGIVQETIERHFISLMRLVFLEGLKMGIYGESDLWSMVLSRAAKENPCIYGVEVPYSLLSVPCFKPWDYEL